MKLLHYPNKTKQKFKVINNIKKFLIFCLTSLFNSGIGFKLRLTNIHFFSFNIFLIQFVSLLLGRFSITNALSNWDIYFKKSSTGTVKTHLVGYPKLCNEHQIRAFQSNSARLNVTC